MTLRHRLQHLELECVDRPTLGQVFGVLTQARDNGGVLLLPQLHTLRISRQRNNANGPNSEAQVTMWAGANALRA
jgi:hypothetical protein